MLAAPGRLTTALVRPSAASRRSRSTWTTAIAEAAPAAARRSSTSTGRTRSRSTSPGRCRIEAQYLANKLAKGFVGTNQIESNSRLCMASAGTGYKLSLGADGPPGSYEDFDHADVFFVIGSNMADCHPILFLRMMDRVKARREADRRRPAPHRDRRQGRPVPADRPGTDLALLNGLLHLLRRERRTSTPDFIAEHTEGWEAMPAFLADYPPDAVAEITGIAEDDIRTAAADDRRGAANWMSCWTMGLNQSTHGTWNTNAIVQPAPGHRRDLPARQRPVLAHRPAERDGRPRDGLHGAGPARAAVGARSPPTARSSRSCGGCRPGTLARPRSARAPSTCSGGWPTARSRRAGSSAPIPSRPWPTADGHRGPGGAPSSSSPRTSFAETETNAYADVVLPGRAVGRGRGRDGQLRAQPDPAAAGRRPARRGAAGLADHRRVARAMGFARRRSPTTRAEEVFDEITRFWNPQTGYDLRGVTYERLRAEPGAVAVRRRAATATATRSATSTTASARRCVDEDGSRPRLAFPTPTRPGACSSPAPHLARRRDARRRLSRSCSTPAACSTSGTP